MSTEQTPTIPEMPSDAELFRSSTAPEPAAPVTPEPAAPAPAQAEPAAPPTGYADRDERGRFKAQSPEPQQPAAEDDDKSPPSHRFKELREERDAYARRIREMEFAYYDMAQKQRAMQEAQARQQQQQKPEQIPDIISDPQGYHHYVQNQFTNQLRTQEQNFSFRLAHQQHGENFEHAYGEMIARAERGDPSIVRAVMASPDPGQAMINWYRQASALARIGDTDPESWAEKVWLEERMKDPKFAGQMLEKIRGTTATASAQQTNGGPAVSIPPSLNRMAAAAPSTAANGDMSDASLFDFAFRQGRTAR